MVSKSHEEFIQLFRECPQLTAALPRNAQPNEIPSYSEITVISADFTTVQPTEYRADLVLQFSRGKPTLGVIIEAQLSIDDRKKFSWPVYLTTLRARLKCPVELWVVTNDRKVARWASEPICLGHDNWFKPTVLDPAALEAIVVDEAKAKAMPELFVLAVLMNAQYYDDDEASQIDAMAMRVLDADRHKLYLDMIEDALDRHRGRNVMTRYREEWKKTYGLLNVAPQDRKVFSRLKLLDRHQLVTKLLRNHFGELPEDVLDRLDQSCFFELDDILDNFRPGITLDEVRRCFWNDKVRWTGEKAEPTHSPIDTAED